MKPKTFTMKIPKLDKATEKEFDEKFGYCGKCKEAGLYGLALCSKCKIADLIESLNIKQFLAQKLAQQKTNTIKEVEEKIRLRMMEEVNTPIKERKNGWDILKEVRDILNKLK